MNVVFGGGLWPIGQSVAFVELSLQATLEHYERWAENWEDLPSFRELGDAPLVDLLGALLPLEMPYRRRLLVGTAGGWTAIFDNGRGGGDPFPPASFLSRSAGVRGVAAGHTPPEQYPYPATQLHLFGPTGRPPLMYVRTINAGIFDEGRWQFEVRGTPQPFEDLERYKARRVRDRFDRVLLLEYLAALDIHADDAGWYRTGVLVTDGGSWKPSWTATLEQARADATEVLKSRR
jgi:hypothetical protein